MARSIEAAVSADGTRLVLDSVNRAALRGLAGERVVIGKDKATRSERANRYLWGVVYRWMSIEQVGKDHDETKEAIHDAMCERFLTNEQRRVEFFNRLTGECLTVDTTARRSSRLAGDAFYDFVEDVREFARTFLNVETPDPDPEYWRKRERRAA